MYLSMTKCALIGLNLNPVDHALPTPSRLINNPKLENDDGACPYISTLLLETPILQFTHTAPQ